MRRRSVLALPAMTLLGCGQLPQKPIDRPDLSLANAGLITGKSLSQRWFPRQKSGLSLVFRNQATGEYFSSTSSDIGYTTPPHFALYLPTGRYALNAIFTYDGWMGPAPDPFVFDASSGQAIYIGTITHTLEWSKEAEQLGSPASAKRYGKLRCANLGLSCDGRHEGNSLNAVAQAPYAMALVFDEWPTIHSELQGQFGAFPLESLSRSLVI